MKLTLAGCATAVFALVAMATAPQAAASPDDTFLQALARAGFSFPATATPQVLQGGHSVCQGFASGKTYKDAVAGIASSTGGSEGIAGAFVRAATSTFCPNYKSLLP
ncbi:MAG TPA: DUF732 domain-containing protein [Mycobacterium sp.]|jgi:hypothetical protein|nr:DUF732 domain-containing protein [Mycobacterium sp.]